MIAPRTETGISRAGATRLIRAAGQELVELLRQAGAVRDARTGRTLTYLRKFSSR